MARDRTARSIRGTLSLDGCPLRRHCIVSDALAAGGYRDSFVSQSVLGAFPLTRGGDRAGGMKSLPAIGDVTPYLISPYFLKWSMSAKSGHLSKEIAVEKSRLAVYA